MDSLSLLRRVGSFPAVLIVLSLFIGGISACQAISQFIAQSGNQLVSVQSARAGK